MLIPNQQVLDTLAHWAGDTRLEEPAFEKQCKSLDANDLSPDLISSFGNSTINAFVGFIDLAGFSATAKDKNPEDVARYLTPFFEKIVPIITGRYAMIDKLIGDEIMFVLPEYLGFDRTATTLFLGQMLGGLHDAAIELAPDYRFRIGISYGPVFLLRIRAGGYTEWTVLGETVNVAKRLHALPELAEPDPVVGAFGLRSSIEREDSIRKEMENTSQMIAGFASRWDLTIPDAGSDFKGVGHVLWSTFTTTSAVPESA